MTTLPMVVGLVPLALGLEAGGDMLQPMAVAAIGGLCLEIAVALFLMPGLYAVVHSTREAAGARLAAGTESQ
jgi:multidrug efflux pump subunit AcrB